MSNFLGIARYSFQNVIEDLSPDQNDLDVVLRKTAVMLSSHPPRSWERNVVRRRPRRFRAAMSVAQPRPAEPHKAAPKVQQLPSPIYTYHHGFAWPSTLDPPDCSRLSLCQESYSASPRPFEEVSLPMVLEGQLL